MRGLITDRHLDEAETAFPGIQRFYETLSNKPSTFLDLVWAFERSRPSAAEPRPAAATSRG